MAGRRINFSAVVAVGRKNAPPTGGAPPSRPPKTRSEQGSPVAAGLEGPSEGAGGHVAAAVGPMVVSKAWRLKDKRTTRPGRAEKKRLQRAAERDAKLAADGVQCQ